MSKVCSDINPVINQVLVWNICFGKLKMAFWLRVDSVYFTRVTLPTDGNTDGNTGNSQRSFTCLGRITVAQCYQAAPIFNNCNTIEFLIDMEQD